MTVTYNLITDQTILKNLVRSRYLIAAATNAFIISMFVTGACSIQIRASSERENDVLPVETENRATSIIRNRNSLSQNE